jgi:tetratricopeptide (TPR) repeat protein
MFKNLIFVSLVVATVLVVLPSTGLGNSGRLLNRVEGQIFDENRVPLGDMYVELLNEVESMIGTKRSTTSGRFSFSGLSNGNFKIRVLPSGKNFLTQTREIEFASAAGSEIQFVEFYMRVDKRFSVMPELSPPEVVFAQDVPEEARKLYRTGIDRLQKNDSNGLADLERSIEIFPKYFDALNRLGVEYARRNLFDKSYPHLLVAIDVNPRSYWSFHYLGVTFLQLKEYQASLKAAEAAVALRPELSDSHLLYGTALRLVSSYEKSETELKKSIELSKTPNAEANWQLALLYNRLGRNKEAADKLEEYLKTDPSSSKKKEIKDLIAKLRSAK